MEAYSCSCYADEIAEYSRSTKRKARKVHLCGECGSKIEIGMYYYENCLVVDGCWMRMKNCAQCEQIREDYGCGVVGGLDEVVRELLGIGINDLE